jgi:hypothetical protein
MNLKAISSFKALKGKCSLLIQEKGNIINIYKIDHQKKTVIFFLNQSVDYIDSLTSITEDDLKIDVNVF